MNIKLTLRNINKKTDIGTVNIYLNFVDNEVRRQLFIRTSIRIEARYWSKKSELVLKAHPTHKEFNSILTEEKASIWGLIEQMRIDRVELTARNFEDYKSRRELKEQGLITLSKDYLNSRQDLSFRHKEKFSNLISRLEEFSKGQEIRLSDINKDWFDSFKRHLERENPQAQNYRLKSGQQPITINKTFSFLKQILSHLNSKGLIDDKFKSYKAVKSFTTKKVVFTKDDISKFMQYEPESPRLKKVKEIALLLLSTGLRISDVFKISKATMDAQFIKIFNQKTQKYTSVPLYPSLNEIIERNGYDISKLKISNAKFNKYIKELCLKVGFNEIMEMTVYENGVAKQVSLPRYSLITSHTFRRSFITLAIYNGLAPQLIQVMTGHSTLRQLNEYVHLPEQMILQVGNTLESVFTDFNQKYDTKISDQKSNIGLLEKNK